MQKTLLNRPVTHSVSVVNLLSVLRRITFAQLLERDMFQDRINNNEPLFMHEMLYPVVQGIDSDVLAQIYGSCDLEVGGTDQTFNLLMGRKVMEMTGREQQSILSFELLVGLDGKEKMSKSLDNYIAITDQPKEMFGKLMSISDAALGSYLELCTFTPMDEVKSIIINLENGKAHPKEVKMNLAEQVVAIYHGRDAANDARESFVHTFQNKEIPTDVASTSVTKGTLLSDALVSAGVLASKSEFRRLLDEGAIRIDGETKIEDPHFAIEENVILKIGKHRFIAFELT
jgi:tyrosyl-tRNA synthetase